MRRAALGGLALRLEELDCRLLSRDLDGEQPFLDPREPISESQVQQAASILKLSVEEVRTRYAALAPRFHLQLAWRAD